MDGSSTKRNAFVAGSKVVICYNPSDPESFDVKGKEKDGTGYPVGKTNSMTLYPMTFGEFLLAVGEGKLEELVESGDAKLLSAFGAKLKDLLKTYLLVGGMPAAVDAYARTLSLAEARAVQQDVLWDYARDFSKHAPKRNVPRIAAVWDSLPRQLAKEDKRFVSAEVVVDGAKVRARDLHDPFTWLEAACGMFRFMRLARCVGVCSN